MELVVKERYEDGRFWPLGAVEPKSPSLLFVSSIQAIILSLAWLTLGFRYYV